MENNNFSQRERLDALSNLLSQITNLKASEVANLVGLSERQWHRLVHQNQAPKPIALSQGSVAWRYLDVLEWCKGREIKYEKGIEHV